MFTIVVARADTSEDRGSRNKYAALYSTRKKRIKQVKLCLCSVTSRKTGGNTFTFS